MAFKFLNGKLLFINGKPSLCCCPGVAEPCPACDADTTPDSFEVVISGVFGDGGSVAASSLNTTYTLPPRAGLACGYGLVYGGPSNEWEPTEDGVAENWSGVDLGGGYYLYLVYIDISGGTPTITMRIGDTGTPGNYLNVNWYDGTDLSGDCMSTMVGNLPHFATTDFLGGAVEVISPTPDASFTAQ